jgi:hypothetical protein
LSRHNLRSEGRAEHRCRLLERALDPVEPNHPGVRGINGYNAT